MDDRLIRDIAENFRDRLTSELSAIVQSHDLAAYSEEAFKAFESILASRALVRARIDAHEGARDIDGLRDIACRSDSPSVSEEERMAASNALLRIAPPTTLVEMARDARFDAHSRAEAIRALGRRGQTALLPDLIALVEEASTDVRAAATETVGILSPSAISSMTCGTCGQVSARGFAERLRICPKCSGAFRAPPPTPIAFPQPSRAAFRVEQESAGSLERVGKAHRGAWYRRALATSIAGLLLAAIGPVFARWIAPELSKMGGSAARYDGWDRVLFELVYGPKRFADTAALVASLIAIPLGALFIIRGIDMWVRGPPKAAKTPQATLRRFVDDVLFEATPRRFSDGGTLHLESFVCLLQAARDRLTDDLAAYRQYCKAAAEEVRGAVSAALHPDHGQELRVNSWRFKSTSAATPRDHATTCEAVIMVRSSASMLSNGNRVSRSLPDCYLLVRLPLVLVGERWYIADLDWSGHVLKTRDATVGVRFEVSPDA